MNGNLLRRHRRMGPFCFTTSMALSLRGQGVTGCLGNLNKTNTNGEQLVAAGLGGQPTGCRYQNHRRKAGRMTSLYAYKYDIALKSADETRGQNEDARRAALQAALLDAGMVIVWQPPSPQRRQTMGDPFRWFFVAVLAIWAGAIAAALVMA